MPVRLIRENSDTPNITNRDDARMIRYAYGGQNGFVKGRGAELSHTVNGNVFTINSGLINLQGWEIEIDSNGWSTALSASDAAIKYCAVYCEVNLSLGGSAKIDLMTALNDYPAVPEGDDLTENPNGTARLVLYRFIAQSGNISNVNKLVKEITYSGEPLSGYDISKGTIEQRLQSLGFKTGVIVSDFIINDYSLTRQGNYVIGHINLSARISSDPQYLAGVIATLPEFFRPKNKIVMNVYGTYITVLAGGVFRDDPLGAEIEINTNGQIAVTKVLHPTVKTIMGIYIYFGFEAESIS